MTNQQCNIVVNNKVLVSPGDLIDKHTILILKVAELKLSGGQRKLEKTKVLLEELERLDIVLENIYNTYANPAMKRNEFNSTLQNLTAKLSAINTEQWDLENEVREGKNPHAAKEARQNNTLRVSIKNKINELFEYPTEIKEYQVA